MAGCASGSSQTLQNTSPLDLSSWPPIYVSNTHFETKDLHELEDDLTASGALLTYDIKEAEIVLSKVLKVPRIRLDLRGKGLYTKDIKVDAAMQLDWSIDSTTTRPKKKQKTDDSANRKDQNVETIVIDDSSTASEDEVEPRKRSTRTAIKTLPHNQSSEKHVVALPSSGHPSSGRIIIVAKVEWFKDSKKLGSVQPLDKYTTYRARCTESPEILESDPPIRVPLNSSSISGGSLFEPTNSALVRTSILDRAKEDIPLTATRWDRFGRRKYGTNTPSANPASWEAGHGTSQQYAHLLQETTTEHDDGLSGDLPEMPEWVKQGIKYACQRPTPKLNLNNEFIDLLKKIRLARTLTNDEIGVRAYSTSIASLSAYDHRISDPREILKLPGCDHKIANLWIEWKNTGKIQAVEDIESDEDMKVLHTFYNIWGVGSTTARDFYFNKGWFDLDDIIEKGWDQITRQQQIGIKFYDEFLDPIPRDEVEQIERVVRQHAVKVRDEGIRTMIVGGYRRGKEASGDVDILISHPDQSATLDLVEDLVASLSDESDQWVPYTLTMSLHNSKRDQQTLPYREGGGGHGFDTLDKALVVWQNPGWLTSARDLAENPKAKNPNIHRRVDLIITPWRTVGCAVVGWSGGTTFERDLRRYAKHEFSWKFDSSGVRDRRNGEVVDLEGYYSWKGKEGAEGRAKSMEEAERRVFEGFGLTYREPTERCTG